METTGLQSQISNYTCGNGRMAITAKDAGVDIFHCSQRRFWEPEFEGSDLNFAGWAKKSLANQLSQ